MSDILRAVKNLRSSEISYGKIVRKEKLRYSMILPLFFLFIYSVDIHLLSLTKHDFKDIYFTTTSLKLINVIRYTTVKINTE